MISSIAPKAVMNGLKRTPPMTRKTMIPCRRMSSLKNATLQIPRRRSTFSTNASYLTISSSDFLNVYALRTPNTNPTLLPSWFSCREWVKSADSMICSTNILCLELVLISKFTLCILLFRVRIKEQCSIYLPSGHGK